MKKFTNLLIKEIRELVTAQLIISLALDHGPLLFHRASWPRGEVKKAEADAEDRRPGPGRVRALQGLADRPEAWPTSQIDGCPETDQGGRRPGGQAERHDPPPRHPAGVRRIRGPVRAQGDRDLLVPQELLHRRHPEIRDPQGGHHGDEQLSLRRLPQEEGPRRRPRTPSRTPSRPRISSSSRTGWPRARLRPSPGSSIPSRSSSRSS